MPRKPTLSPSKISTYLACPVKYRWTYVDETGRWYMRSKSYYSFGTTLHRVLQRFHDSGDTGVQTAHQAVAALEEHWIDAGYSSQEEMNEALGEGKAIVEAYVERMKFEPVTAKTLYIEKSVRADLGPFVLIGRIDRVDEHEDGSLEIVDYKSGRTEVSEDEVASDLAMSCYQLLLHETHPGRTICASILALRSGNRATASLSMDDLTDFRRDLVALGTEILEREYETIEPVWKDLCPECDFLPLCRRHPEFTVPEPNGSG